jgi:hypothetical protein
MIIVRVILVETTRPVRMRPRIETSLVNGHFLSKPICIVSRLLSRYKLDTRTNVGSVNRLCGRLVSKSHILIPPLLLCRHLLSAYPSHLSCGQTGPGGRVNTTHHEPLRFGREVVFGMPFQPAKRPINSAHLQKGQPPTNLISHVEAEVEDVLEVVLTTAEMGDLVLSRTTINCIVLRQLPKTTNVHFAN